MRTMAVWIGVVLMVGGLWSASVISQGLADEPAAPSSASEATGGAAGKEASGSEAAPPVVEGEPAPSSEAGEVQERAVRITIVPDPSAQVIGIYENPNLGGRSQILGVGEYRLCDFNDLASSIYVPTGLVAMLYEHADAGGGYGISVDLLENRFDLSQVGFNDKLSYIRVFNRYANVGTYIWMRNSVQNGQFIWGHWERTRASGTPVNITAVVSPPLPPHSVSVVAQPVSITQVVEPITGSAAPITAADADRILCNAGNILQIRDSANDVACPVELGRVGNIATAEGPISIDSQAELDQVFALPGYVKVVDEINYCGGMMAPSAVGCGGRREGRPRMVVERYFANSEGMVWAHEYGHTKGLEHRTDSSAALMYPSGGREVNATECAAFRSP